MKSQYEGKCGVCGTTWKPGDEIHYQKDPKCICKDRTCWDKQVAAGGADKLKNSAPHGQAATVPQRTDEAKLMDSKKMLELLWCPALTEAAKVYPDIPQTETHGVANITWQGEQKERIRQRMILAQTFFKAMVAEWTR